jgi:hypothetical protein
MRHILPRPAFLLFTLLLLTAAEARAQIPFYTDDADTTERGKVHVEFFNEHDVLQKSAYPAKRQNTANFTLNYGLSDRVEFDVNFPILTIVNAKTAPQGTVAGVGDTQFGVKYRFIDEREGSRLPAMAVVFYVEAPTGDSARQLGSGLTDYWLYGVAQKSLTKKVKGRLNGGVLFSGNSSTGLIGISTTKGQVFTGNGSLVRDFTEKLTLGAELFGAVTNNFQLSKGQLTAQVGGIYTLSENFTFTFGVLGGRFAASPRAGFHLGFAYDFK